MGVIPTDCRVGGFSISCLLWISLNSKCSALNSPSSAISIITIHTLHYVTISPVLYMANLSRGKPLRLERKLVIYGNSSMLVYLYILSIDTRPYIRSGTMHKKPLQILANCFAMVHIRGDSIIFVLFTTAWQTMLREVWLHGTVYGFLIIRN